MTANPRVAIVCDWLESYAGAERVIEQILNCFPDADIFAIVDFIDKKDRGFIKNKPVNTTFIQKLPWSKKLYRHYLPLMPLAIEQLDLQDYQIIISSSHAVAKGVITGPNQLHISYIHSPLRYAWDMQNEYMRRHEKQDIISNWLIRYFLFFIRNWDSRSINGVDVALANSAFIKRRIKKCYNRDSQIVYPPVDTNYFQKKSEKQDYYLTVSRLVQYKRIDIIIEAFNNHPDKKLVIIGDGPEKEQLKRMAKSNITFLGHQPQSTLLEYLQNARAFIFAAQEDFGIAPIEAQACGTPVIAYSQGGTRESIISLPKKNASGVFFHAQSSKILSQAIDEFEKNIKLITAENCRKNAERFSIEQFKEKIKTITQESWERHVNEISEFDGHDTNEI